MKLGKIDTGGLRHHARQARHHTTRTVQFIYRHGFSTRKRTYISLAVVAFLPIVMVQLLYPSHTTLPHTTVDAVRIGGMSKVKAAARLDAAYADAQVPIYFTDSQEVVVAPTFQELGISTDNAQRVEAYTYPLVWRLVPWSLFWYQAFIDKGDPLVHRDDSQFNMYTAGQFGPTCDFAPRNGTIIYDADEGPDAGLDEDADEGTGEGALRLIEASRGGSCDMAELTAALRGVEVALSPRRVTVRGTSVAPEISTDTAQTELHRVQAVLSRGVTLKVADATETLKADTVAPWLEYTVQDGHLQLNIQHEAATQWLRNTYGARFTSAAGVTKVTIRDYAEAGRETGAKGSVLNTDATISEVTKVLRGDTSTAALVVDTIEPKVTYERTYSPANKKLSEIMKHYADTHPGVYGVKLVELSGQRRNAEYNATRQFTTASTYKMFVAYSILLRIERGELHWGDASYGGYTISTCFDRMIELSNNECAVDLLLKVSYAGVQADAHAIGATHTYFPGRGQDITSNAHDESLLLSLLYTGQILTEQASRDRMIAAMKGNVYVKGIPSGVPGIEVADKVGFLDALLHDAAIVYSPKGTYVLIVMTDNASWADIAVLAGELEAAR